MSDRIEILYGNESRCIVTASSRGIFQEMNETFSFLAPNHQFHPKFKNRMWDGRIKLFSMNDRTLPAGLIGQLKDFCELREYELDICNDYSECDEIPDDYGYQLAEEAGIPFKLHDYQNKYIVSAIRERRAICKSPVNSGKSLIQYLIMQHYRNAYELKTLIIVPTSALVMQMKKDFGEYGLDSENLVHMIPMDKSKDTKKPVVVTTWQSIVNQPREWFDQFGLVLGDEVHTFEAKSLVSIMENCVNVRFRFGFTGTISRDSKVHQLVLEGHFGRMFEYIQQAELIDRGISAQFEAKCLMLDHNATTKQVFKDYLAGIKKDDMASKKFMREKKFISMLPSRNKFIKNLVHSLENENTLVLFTEIDHGKKLAEMMRELPGREVHLVYGGTPVTEREEIRHLVENDKEKKHILVASFGVFSTGVNLKRLDNIVFASSYKAEIKIIQSIGRVLRKGNGADDTKLFDIVDILKTKGGENYTLQHFRKRWEIYGLEKFKTKIITVQMK